MSLHQKTVYGEKPTDGYWKDWKGKEYVNKILHVLNNYKCYQFCLLDVFILL
jgi:hypothetical protein